ncbi:MAG TPA: sugar ABC transporter substrate-binding protein [bacterium]|nr:sugar ABC transporter substrate-binding protein [bacterium]
MPKPTARNGKRSAPQPHATDQISRRRLLRNSIGAFLGFGISGYLLSDGSQPTVHAATAPWVDTTGPLEGAGREPVTLRFLDEAGSPWDEGHEAMITEFQRQYPSIKVQRNAMPFTELYRQIQTQVAASEPPDVLYIDGPAVASFAAENVLLPLNPYIPADDLHDFYPSSLEEATWGGKLYGLASEQSVPLLYYRLDAFEAAGIKPPDSLATAWTWPQAFEALKKVTKPDRYGLDLISGQYLLAGCLRSAGDPKAPKTSSAYKAWAGISPDGRTVVGYQDAPEVIRAMQLFQDMWKQNIMPSSPIPDAMPTGRAAAWLGAEWAEGKLVNKYASVKWSVTPAPYFHSPFVHNGSLAFTVSARTRHAKEAVLFARWMTSRSGERLWFQYNPQLPARRSVANTTDVYKRVPKSLDLQEFERESAPRIRIPIYTQYTALLNQTITNVSAGADVKTEMTAFASKVQTALDDFWSTHK